MKGFKSKKGISLIVLVITIIVMIILAAAIILSLNNSGIIDKANKAKKDSDTANLKEYVNVLTAEWELGTKATSKEEYVNEKLYEKYPDTALSADGKVYSGLNKKARAAIASGIKIGDKVTGYTPTTEWSETSGDENTESGYSELENGVKQKVYRTEYVTWRYIGISDNGEVMIAPDMIASENIADNQKMRLSGIGGYLYGPIELDNICDKLYSVEGVGKAKSMNREHVNMLLNYTGPKGFYNDKGGNEVWTTEAEEISTISSKIGYDMNSFMYYPLDTGAYKANYYTIENTSKNITTEYIDFIYYDTEYLLATSSVKPSFSGNYVALDVYRVTSDEVGVKSIWVLGSSYGSDKTAVRPVVYINSDVLITKNASTGYWDIQS